MRILYVDIVSMPEHLVYNRGLLRALGNNNSVDVCAAKDYFSKEDCRYIKYYSIPDKYIFAINKPKKNIQVIYRKRTLCAYLWIKHNIPLENYDVVWFSYTEPITFFLTFNNCQIPVVYCDHLINEIKNSNIKQWFSKRINKSYIMLYFEAYIGSYLLDELKLKNTLYLVKHPLPKIDVKECPIQNILFAPANSNDEQFIDFLTDNESRLPEGLKIIIRSRNRTFESKKLKVYSHRLPNDDYYKIMRSCVGVLINYGDNYNYRTSTVWFESLVNRKPCYMYCGNTMKTYAESYPEIIMPFCNNEEFIRIIGKWNENIQNCKSNKFDRTLEDYSDLTVQNQVENVLRGIKKNG